MCHKFAGLLANRVDADETPHSAAFHLGLYSLLRPAYPNTYGKYSIAIYERFCKKSSKGSDYTEQFYWLKEKFTLHLSTEQEFARSIFLPQSQKDCHI